MRRALKLIDIENKLAEMRPLGPNYDLLAYVHMRIFMLKISRCLAASPDAAT